MRAYKKHHAEHLDGTRGAWRPTLIASMIGADGHPIAWKEIVVVSCHNCGLQYGVGGDDGGPQIKPDGTTDIPVICHNCKTEDHMTFEKHQESEGREHYAKLKEAAQTEADDARHRHIQEHFKAKMYENIEDITKTIAKKIIPSGAPNRDKLLKQFIDEQKAQKQTNAELIQKAIQKYLQDEE